MLGSNASGRLPYWRLNWAWARGLGGFDTRRRARRVCVPAGDWIGRNGTAIAAAERETARVPFLCVWPFIPNLHLHAPRPYHLPTTGVAVGDPKPMIL